MPPPRIAYFTECIAPPREYGVNSLCPRYNFLGFNSKFPHEALRRFGDLADSSVERGLVGLRRFSIAAHFADKLKGSGGDFFGGDRGFGAAKDFDAAAHGLSSTVPELTGRFAIGCDTSSPRTKL